MFDLVRKLVAGPKRKTFYEGNELDLTYITDRVIAMAFPASGLIEQTYRNSITDVANYLNSRHHQNYLIINVSSRYYDHKHFLGQVTDYYWPDHQAPPLTTLIEISHEIKRFLDSNSSVIEEHPQPLNAIAHAGVVCVHCNHGKGRTGTAIISFMLYIGFFGDAKYALYFYNKKRFDSATYGVDQPCQTRYLHFVQQIKQMPNIPRKMITYKLQSLHQTGLNDNCFISVHQTRSGNVKYKKILFGKNMNIDHDVFLIGDIFIQLFSHSWTGTSRLARINYNLFFLNPHAELNVKQFQVVFHSKNISAKKDCEPFSIVLDFEYYCLCHVSNTEGLECLCSKERKVYYAAWINMIYQLDDAKKYTKPSQSYSYFYENTLSSYELYYYLRKKEKARYYYFSPIKRYDTDHPYSKKKYERKNTHHSAPKYPLNGEGSSRRNQGLEIPTDDRYKFEVGYQTSSSSDEDK